MRQITFPGFTKQYVVSLSHAGTTAIYPLTREAAAQNHRLREPLLLYALANGQEKVLMTAARNTVLAEYYGNLLENSKTVRKISSPSRPASQALMTSEVSGEHSRSRSTSNCFRLSGATVKRKFSGMMGRSFLFHLA